ncbi:hypothetical protein SAY87_013322 [Trapa incisa]|uniref:Uncharacterized protein n=1 Tax=Trapa incisa TaxID=236973 RepID=A0AAN7KBC4_9MYRT|nr:hypothetical protein SAY87_013322 [Trapa incisa]
MFRRHFAIVVAIGTLLGVVSFQAAACLFSVIFRLLLLWFSPICDGGLCGFSCNVLSRLIVIAVGAVKRPTKVSDTFIDPMLSVGTKRSIRDRVLFMLDYEDARIDKDDLRHMLMQKNIRRLVESNEERNGSDLREKLVKKVYAPHLQGPRKKILQAMAPRRKRQL